MDWNLIVFIYHESDKFWFWYIVGGLVFFLAYLFVLCAQHAETVRRVPHLSDFLDMFIGSAIAGIFWPIFIAFEVGARAYQMVFFK